MRDTGPIPDLTKRHTVNPADVEKIGRGSDQRVPGARGHASCYRQVDTVNQDPA
ncbi:hypothetical protein GCM10023259_063640 [Thermocatellispora tengchongensis]